MIRDFLILKLPIYIMLKPTTWTFAMWSAPTVPATTFEYIKALRVTIRDKDDGVILVIKRGEI